SARLAQTEGQVADNATREQLRQALDAAGKVQSNKPDDYRKAQAAIQAALDAVNASAQTQAEAAAQAAQAQQAAQASQAPAQIRPQATAPYHQGAAPGGSGGGYRGGAPAPAPASPAPAGGGESWKSKLPPLDTSHHGCNDAGVCGIG
ncbi:hypothetical protein CRD59_07505, partial [Bifidobacterium xylocopae]